MVVWSEILLVLGDLFVLVSWLDILQFKYYTLHHCETLFMC